MFDKEKFYNDLDQFEISIPNDKSISKEEIHALIDRDKDDSFMLVYDSFVCGFMKAGGLCE